MSPSIPLRCTSGQAYRARSHDRVPTFFRTCTCVPIDVAPTLHPRASFSGSIRESAVARTARQLLPGNNKNAGPIGLRLSSRAI
jgi:hypothetical protein